jgi:hypothetical protein
MKSRPVSVSKKRMRLEDGAKMAPFLGQIPPRNTQLKSLSSMRANDILT